jgi:hypothetical protein
MPLDVSQSGSSANPNDPAQKSKLEQGGKKFGKKLGNAGMSILMVMKWRWSNSAYSNLRCRCHCWLQHCEQHLLIVISMDSHVDISFAATSDLTLKWRWWLDYA